AVHDMETNREMSSGRTPINLVRLLHDDVSNVSPDMTQRVDRLEGSYYLTTVLAPALLRTQLDLGADLVSFSATPDSKGILLLKKHTNVLQYLALDGHGVARDFIKTPTRIDQFGVEEQHDYIYTISEPENEHNEL